MRALLQRVSEASVEVEGEGVAAIGPGLLLLLGVATGDSHADVRWLAEKCSGLRIFEDEEGKMNRSVLESGGEVLVVSQFTLYGDARRGRRPSWSQAASGEEAESLYRAFCMELERTGLPVRTGEFGAMMTVRLVNEGPVTIMVESPR